MTSIKQLKKTNSDLFDIFEADNHQFTTTDQHNTTTYHFARLSTHYKPHGAPPTGRITLTRTTHHMALWKTQRYHIFTNTADHQNALDTIGDALGRVGLATRARRHALESLRNMYGYVPTNTHSHHFETPETGTDTHALRHKPGTLVTDHDQLTTDDITELIGDLSAEHSIFYLNGAQLIDGKPTVKLLNRRQRPPHYARATVNSRTRNLSHLKSGGHARHATTLAPRPHNYMTPLAPTHTLRQQDEHNEVYEGLGPMNPTPQRKSQVRRPDVGRKRKPRGRRIGLHRPNP